MGLGDQFPYLIERCRIPRVLGAALVLAALIGGVSWVALSLSGGAGLIVKTLPAAAVVITNQAEDGAWVKDFLLKQSA